MRPSRPETSRWYDTSPCAPTAGRLPARRERRVGRDRHARRQRPDRPGTRLRPEAEEAGRDRPDRGAGGVVRPGLWIGLALLLGTLACGAAGQGGDERLGPGSQAATAAALGNAPAAAPTGQ